MGWNATAIRSDSDSSPRSLILESYCLFLVLFGGLPADSSADIAREGEGRRGEEGGGGRGSGLSFPSIK